MLSPYFTKIRQDIVYHPQRLIASFVSCPRRNAGTQRRKSRIKSSVCLAGRRNKPLELQSVPVYKNCDVSAPFIKSPSLARWKKVSKRWNRESYIACFVNLALDRRWEDLSESANRRGEWERERKKTFTRIHPLCTRACTQIENERGREKERKRERLVSFFQSFLTRISRKVGRIVSRFTVLSYNVANLPKF